MNPLILVRHGNTFEAGQPAVWVGARTDLPLTSVGEKQAEALAAWIAGQGKVAHVVAGPLKRTARCAAIIAAKAGVKPCVDERLREIDYGLWAGLDSATVAARYGLHAWESWDEKDVWPEGMGWAPSREEILERLTSFLGEQRAHLSEGLVVAVTSNGILRLMHTLFVKERTGQTPRVKTGNFCTVEAIGNTWKITAWDQKPVL